MRTDTNVRRVAIAGFALVLYLILSLIYFGTIGDYGRMYLGLGSDPTAYIWFLNWWPWAITHGHNPFISYYVWYPHGFNMTWAGSVPGAALLMFPVTWLTNAVVSFNILTLLAPAISAWSAFLLARHLTRDTPASIFGGYLFGFSSYELGHMLGHLSLDVIFVVPLLALLVLQRLNSDLSRRRFVALLAVVLLFQLGLSTEILATVCFFGALTWAVFFAFATSQERRRLLRVASEIILAGGIMGILAAPFLFYVVKGLADVPHQIHPAVAYSTDLLNYIVPTEITGPGSHMFKNIARRFPGNASEQGAYLGLPLILILILYFRDNRRQPYIKPLLVTLLAILVLSLGPSMHVAGVDTHLWLPWGLGLRLPFIGHALPVRFTMYVALIAALVVTLWLSVAKRGWHRIGRFGLAALGCLSLVPNRAMVHWTPLSPEPFFEPQNFGASLGQDANVIMLPYGYTGPSLTWQWQSGMRFTQSGGYVGFIPPSESVWRVFRNFEMGVGGPGFENDLSAFCATHDVSAILVGPGTPDPLVAAIEALHWQQTNDHGVRVVRVPNFDSLRFYYIEGDYWPEMGPESWMGDQIKVVTHGRPVQVRITARYLPTKLDPIDVSVINGSVMSNYRLSEQGTQVLAVPADTSVWLKANATFVPDQVYRNGDQRQLSVRVQLDPESGDER